MVKLMGLKLGGGGGNKKTKEKRKKRLSPSASNPDMIRQQHPMYQYALDEFAQTVPPGSTNADGYNNPSLTAQQERMIEDDNDDVDDDEQDETTTNHEERISSSINIPILQQSQSQQQQAAAMVEPPDSVVSWSTVMDIETAPSNVTAPSSVHGSRSMMDRHPSIVSSSHSQPPPPPAVALSSSSTTTSATNNNNNHNNLSSTRATSGGEYYHDHSHHNNPGSSAESVYNSSSDHHHHHHHASASAATKTIRHHALHFRSGAFRSPFENDMPDATYEEVYGDAYTGGNIKYVYPSGYQSMRPRSCPWKLSIVVCLLFTWLSVFIVGHCSDQVDEEAASELAEKYYESVNNNNNNNNKNNLDDDSLVIDIRWCGSRPLYLMWVASMLITGLSASYCSIIGYIKVRDFAVANSRSQPPGVVEGKSDYYVRIHDTTNNNASTNAAMTFSVPLQRNDSIVSSTATNYRPTIYQSDGTPQFWGSHIYRPTQAAVAITNR